MSWQPRGRVAVVTGASSGIGEATAVRLAGAGMDVVAVARRRDRLEALAAAHDSVHAYAADVTRTSDVDALAAFVADRFGVCHALVNNAGVGGGAFGSRDDLQDAMRTLDVNLGGTVRCTAAFAELLASSAPARVVNVGSVSGKIGLGPAAYAASKFGMVGFSEALSFSWADRDVVVCQLNPGYAVTEGFPQRQVFGTPMERLLVGPDEVAEAILDALVDGLTERTVPKVYRGFVVLRHLVPPLYRRLASRNPRASGTRDPQ